MTIITEGGSSGTTSDGGLDRVTGGSGTGSTSGRTLDYSVSKVRRKRRKTTTKSISDPYGLIAARITAGKFAEYDGTLKHFKSSNH